MSLFGEELDYCYMVERETIACLLGQVTRLLFCLYVKLFLPSNFNSIDCLSSVSCIVLDIELADLNVKKTLGVFIDGYFGITLFVRQKSTNP